MFTPNQDRGNFVVQITELNQAKQRLESQIAVTDQRIDDLEGQLEALGRQLEVAENRNAALNEQIRDLQDQLAQAQDERDQHITRVQALEDEQQARIDNAEARMRGALLNAGSPNQDLDDQSIKDTVDQKSGIQNNSPVSSQELKQALVIQTAYCRLLAVKGGLMLGDELLRESEILDKAIQQLEAETAAAQAAVVAAGAANTNAVELAQANQDLVTARQEMVVLRGQLDANQLSREAYRDACVQKLINQDLTRPLRLGQGIDQIIRNVSIDANFIKNNRPRYAQPTERTINDDHLRENEALRLNHQKEVEVREALLNLAHAENALQPNSVAPATIGDLETNLREARAAQIEFFTQLVRDSKEVNDAARAQLQTQLAALRQSNRQLEGQKLTLQGRVFELFQGNRTKDQELQEQAQRFAALQNLAQIDAASAAQLIQLRDEAVGRLRNIASRYPGTNLAPDSDLAATVDVVPSLLVRDHSAVEHRELKVDLLTAYLEVARIGLAMGEGGFTQQSVVDIRAQLDEARADQIQFYQDQIGQQQNTIDDLEQTVQDLEQNVQDAIGARNQAQEERDVLFDEKQEKIYLANLRLEHNQYISSLESKLDDYTYQTNLQQGAAEVWEVEFVGQNSELPNVAEDRLREILFKSGFANVTEVRARESLVDYLYAADFVNLPHGNKIELYQAAIDYLVLQVWTEENQDLALGFARPMIDATEAQIKLSSNTDADKLRKDLETYQTQLNQLGQKSFDYRGNENPELSGQVMVGVADRVSDYLSEKIANLTDNVVDQNGVNLQRYKAALDHIDQHYKELKDAVKKQQGFLGEHDLSIKNLRDFYRAELEYDLALQHLYGGKQHNTKLHNREYHYYNHLFLDQNDVDQDLAKTNLIEDLSQLLPDVSLVLVDHVAIQNALEASGYKFILKTSERVAAALGGMRLDIENQVRLLHLYESLIEFETKNIRAIESANAQTPAPQAEQTLDGVSLDELKENLNKHKKAFDAALQKKVEKEFDLAGLGSDQARGYIEDKQQSLQNAYEALDVPDYELYPNKYKAGALQYRRAHNENLPLKSRLKAVDHHLNILDAQIAVVEAGGVLTDENGDEILHRNDSITLTTLAGWREDAQSYRNKLKGLYKEERKTRGELVDLDALGDDDLPAIKKSQKAVQDAARKSPGKDLPLKSSAQLRQDEKGAEWNPYSWTDYQAMLAEMSKTGALLAAGVVDPELEKRVPNYPIITTVKMNDPEAFESNGRAKFRDEMKKPVYRMAYYDRVTKVVRDVIVPQEMVEELMKKSPKTKREHEKAHNELMVLARKLEAQRVQAGGVIPEGFLEYNLDAAGTKVQTGKIYTQSGPTIEIKAPTTLSSKQEVTVSFAAIDGVDLAKATTTHYQDLRSGGDPIKTNLYSYKLETTIATKNFEIDGVRFGAGDPLVRVVRVGNGKIQPITDYQGNLLTGVQLGTSDGVYTDIYKKLRNPDSVVSVVSKRFDVDQNKVSTTTAVFKGLGKVEYLTPEGRKEELPYLVGRNGANISSRINYSPILHAHAGIKTDSVAHANNLLPRFKFEVSRDQANVITISNVRGTDDWAQVFADLSARLSNPDLRNGRSKWPWVPNANDPDFKKPLKIVFEGCEIDSLDKLTELSRNFQISAVECKDCPNLRDVSALSGLKDKNGQNSLDTVKITGSPLADLRSLSGLRDKNTTRKLYVTVDQPALTRLQEYGAKYPRDPHHFSSQIKFAAEKSGFVKNWTSLEPKSVEAILQQVAREPESVVFTYLSNEDVVRVRNEATKCGNKVEFGNGQDLDGPNKVKNGDYFRATRVTGNVLRTVLDLSLGNYHYFLDSKTTRLVGKPIPKSSELYKAITPEALKLEIKKSETAEQFQQRKEDTVELIKISVENLQNALRANPVPNDVEKKLLIANFQQEVVGYFGLSLDNSLSFKPAPNEATLRAVSLTEKMLNTSDDNLLKLPPKGSRADLYGGIVLSSLDNIINDQNQQNQWAQGVSDPLVVKQALKDNRSQVSDEDLHLHLDALNLEIQNANIQNVNVALDLSAFPYIQRLHIVEPVTDARGNQLLDVDGKLMTRNDKRSLSQNVTSINLSGCENLNFTELLKEDLKAFPKLTHIDLTGVKLSEGDLQLLQELYKQHPNNMAPNKGKLKIIVSVEGHLDARLLDEKPSPVFDPQGKHIHLESGERATSPISARGGRGD